MAAEVGYHRRPRPVAPAALHNGASPDRHFAVMQSKATSVIRRCFWVGDDPLYIAYHDAEWGRPVADDRRLFEKLCLEGFQAGLSWRTILGKRPRSTTRAARATSSRNSARSQRIAGNSNLPRNRGRGGSPPQSCAR